MTLTHHTSPTRYAVIENCFNFDKEHTISGPALKTKCMFIFIIFCGFCNTYFYLDRSVFLIRQVPVLRVVSILSILDIPLVFHPQCSSGSVSQSFGATLSWPTALCAFYLVRLGDQVVSVLLRQSQLENISQTTDRHYGFFFYICKVPLLFEWHLWRRQVFFFSSTDISHYFASSKLYFELLAFCLRITFF